jgi:hypothetical protein
MGGDHSEPWGGGGWRRTLANRNGQQETEKINVLFRETEKWETKLYWTLRMEATSYSEMLVFTRLQDVP